MPIETTIRGVSAEVALAHSEVLQVFAKHKVECRITSCTGGKHSVGSLHYTGDAIDYGLWHLSNQKVRRKLRDDLVVTLGPDFDVVLESTHIHVEFQPKVPA